MQHAASIWPVAEQWHRSLYQHALAGPGAQSFRPYAPSDLAPPPHEEQQEDEAEVNGGASVQHAASTLAAMARRRSSASASGGGGHEETRPTSSSSSSGGPLASHAESKPVIPQSATYTSASAPAPPTMTPSFSGLYTPPQPEHRASFGATSLGAVSEKLAEDDHDGDGEEAEDAAEKAKLREARRLEALLAGAQG